MSMYQIEDFIESAVKVVANSTLALQQKRNLIYTLFEMEGCGDCGFTNLRTIKEMIACSYSFAFEAEQMYNYHSHRELYDGANRMPYREGDAYYDDDAGKYCIDSGSEAWSEMVKIGAITGDGAIPVELLDYKDVLRTLKTLMPAMDRYTRNGFEMLALITFATDEMSDQECMEIMGKTLEQLEEGDEQDELDAPTAQAPTVYHIAESPVSFHIMAEIDPGNNAVISGYIADCPVTLYETVIPLTFKILLAEPMLFDCGPWKEHMPQATDEDLLEAIGRLAPQTQFEHYVALLNNFLQALNSSPVYISTMMEMGGVPIGSSALCTERIDSVIQLLANGLKMDQYVRVRLNNEKLYTVHSGNISEVASMQED